MHCSIVNHSNKKTPEKTVNRMCLVVLDFDCNIRYSERIRTF